MPTYNEEKSFIEAVIGRSILDDAIEWIRENLNPEDVFPAKELDSWAEDNGYILKKDVEN